MKCIIWGVGERGKRIASRLPYDDVVAFIDSNRAGECYAGKKVLSFQEYLQKYSEYFILVTPLKSEEIQQELKEKGINHFWNMADCPSELQGVVEFEGFDKYIKSYNEGKRYGIYGTSFYSIYFYELLYKSGCETLYLIPEPDADLNKVRKIMEAYDFVQMIPQKEWKCCVDEIYVTVDIREEAVRLLHKLGILVKNVFDLSRILSRYKNQKISKFKDRHKGEKCFIVATGPSLRMEDLDILKQYGERSIGVNRIYLAFEQTQWRPDYYIVCDMYCIEESEDEIKRISVENKFVADTYPKFWEHEVPDNIYKYHGHFSYTENRLPAFSDDITCGMYQCGTVTYDALQLAVYLGFRKIYLLGVDFDFSADYKAKSNHFTDNYYSEKSRTAYFERELQMKAYLAAKEYAEAHGIKIYNATRGGKLEVFERVDFDSLFAEKSEEKSVE
jgi:hypothetical protein